MEPIRQHLIAMLTEPGAHLMFDELIDRFPSAARDKLADGFNHSPWQLLEHLRVCQWDILEFSRDATHTSPAWPDGYWPSTSAPPDKTAWKSSVDAFRRDLAEFVSLIEDESNDLFAPIAHGDGQTLLREALVLARHNSYHLGQLAMLARMLA